MQKITAILAEAGEIVGVAGPQTAADLNRIANALERIASSLEKLTGEPKNNPVITPPQQAPENKVIQLESKTAQPVLPVSVPVKPVTPATIKRIGHLESYLKQRGIDYKLKAESSPEHEQALDTVAIFLGKNFNVCEDLYQALKRNVQTPKNPVIYNLVNSTAELNVRLRELCRLLVKAQILEDYINTDKPEKQLILKPTGKELKYLNGSWLEYYAKESVKRIIQSMYSGKPNPNFEILANVDITFQIGTKTELDVLFSIGREIFCIEAKTNPNLKKLRSDFDQMNSLGFANQHILFLSVNKDEKTCQRFSEELGGVKIVRLDNFKEVLTSMIKAACEPLPQKKAPV